MKLILIISFTFLSCISAYSEICSQSDETCKHYEQCPLDVQAMVEMKPRPAHILSQLFQARCSEGKLQKLCCKSLPPPPPQPECYTWDGRPGVCVPYNKTDIRFTSMSNSQKLFSRCTKRDLSLRLICHSDLPVTQNPDCEPTAFPPDPSTRCCGVDANAESKIAGGTVTYLHEFPWLAVLKYEEDKRNCSGALISGKYVLSAAHCMFYTKPYAVVLGEHDKSSTNDCDETEDCRGNVELTIGIEEIILHEGFNPTNPVVEADIALIRLIKMATYTEFIRPICLPTSITDLTKNPPENFKFWSAGWGDYNAFFTSPSDIKRKVKLPYVNSYKCLESNPGLHTAQICAGGEGNKDTCYGDSGSPLMYDKQGIYEALGITSYSISTTCGIKNIPAIYTKVHSYKAWIHQHIRP